MSIQILPIVVRFRKTKFDLFESLQEFQYRDEDIVVISSKFVSMSEGSLIKLKSIKPSQKARMLAAEAHMNPKIAELILREADHIIKGVPGFLLAIKNGMIAPNAGIDKSNVPSGYVILYPRDPFAVAENLRLRFLIECDVRVGIVIADSRLMPTRIGTTGVAIACAGFEPVEDLRGSRDLFGKVLMVTLKAVADGLATTGVATMGESSESTPAVVIRGAKVRWSDKTFSWTDMTVEPKQDIYLRSTLDEKK